MTISQYIYTEGGIMKALKNKAGFAVQISKRKKVCKSTLKNSAVI